MKVRECYNEVESEDEGRVSIAQDRHFTFLGRFCGRSVGTPNTSKDFSLKDVWRSCSRPSLPFSRGQSGIACSYVLCCRTHWTDVTLNLKVLVDDITAFMNGRNKELVVDGREGSEEAENGGGGGG